MHKVHTYKIILICSIGHQWIQDNGCIWVSSSTSFHFTFFLFLAFLIIWDRCNSPFCRPKMQETKKGDLRRRRGGKKNKIYFGKREVMQTLLSSWDQSLPKTSLPLTPRPLFTLKVLSSNRSYLKKPADLKMYQCLVYRFGGRISTFAFLDADREEGEAVEIIF